MYVCRTVNTVISLVTKGLSNKIYVKNHNCDYKYLIYSNKHNTLYQFNNLDKHPVVCRGGH